MERTKDLAHINMKGGVGITQIYKATQKAMETKLTTGETEMLNYAMGTPSQWIQHECSKEEVQKWE